jgi:signal transduction histidine kinase
MKREPEHPQLEVLIVAPTGQDAALLASVLAREGMASGVFKTVGELSSRLKSDAGALVVSEEALGNEAVAFLNDVFLSQEPWCDLPLIVLTGSGETTLASLRVLKKLSPAGNVTLLERPFRPITLISALQGALRARTRQYQVRALLESQAQATRIRDEFFSIASHELKTPLTSLKLQTQMSERMINSGNPAAFSAERIKKLVVATGNQVDRLTRLVEDMLDVSRISRGKLMIQRSRFDLAQLAREVLENLMPQLSAAGCEVTFTAESEVLGCWDRYRIEQVINNLLTNAIRYSPGRPVRVSVGYTQQAATVTVADQGMGIAPENLERIFGRFERAVLARNISGLGLGLYICREIMESHHGTIRAESKLGEGSAFTLELPFAEVLTNSKGSANLLFGDA